MKAYVNLWRWYDDSVRAAYQSSDPQRTQFAHFHERMWEIKEKDPKQAFQLCERGVRLAQQLNEPCWELFHAYWASEMQIYYVGDIDGGLDYAIRNVAKAHQETYVECPIRARVYITLIGVYTRLDPTGYADEIHEMVRFIEQEIPMDRDTHQRLQYYRAWMHVEFEQYEPAIDELMKYMDMCPYSAFRQQSGYGLMTYIEIDQQRYQAALTHAEQYEASARRAEFETGTVMGLLWRAALERKLGNESDAARILRQGLARAAGLELEKNAGYYNALASYYEAGGEFEKAIEQRNQLMAQFEGTGRISLMAEAQLQQCRVLKRMNKLTNTEIEKAKGFASQLKKPTLYLNNLEKVRRGEHIRGTF
jgi:tetratricopeptide (TPR) repeat protein